MHRQTKTAAIIIISNEILSGQTQDQNVTYIAEKLEKRGIILSEVVIIPDIEQTIIEKVHHYSKEFDYVFTTGGIGPTHDDITTASIAKAFHLKLIRHLAAVAVMKRHYSETGLTLA